MKNKCKKTLSGKHIWREFFDGFKDSRVDKATNTCVIVPGIMKKCTACGMVNDLK